MMDSLAVACICSNWVGTIVSTTAGGWGPPSAPADVSSVPCKIELKSAGEESKLVYSSVLESVEQTILKKIQEIESLIKLEKKLDKLEILKNTLSSWLDTLEKINKIK